VVTGFDPVARRAAAAVLPEAVRFADTLEEAIVGADAILVMTAWPEIKRLPELLARTSSLPLVIDGRRVFNKDIVPQYMGIGLTATRSLGV
jgi:UDPglucose 6-dehydrogenase